MTTKTINELHGELDREIHNLRELIKAHNEPILEKIKQNKQRIKRLLIEDGRQQIAGTMLELD